MTEEKEYVDDDSEESGNIDIDAPPELDEEQRDSLIDLIQKAIQAVQKQGVDIKERLVPETEQLISFVNILNSAGLSPAQLAQIYQGFTADVWPVCQTLIGQGAKMGPVQVGEVLGQVNRIVENMGQHAKGAMDVLTMPLQMIVQSKSNADQRDKVTAPGNGVHSFGYPNPESGPVAIRFRETSPGFWGAEMTLGEGTITGFGAGPVDACAKLKESMSMWMTGLAQTLEENITPPKEPTATDE